MSEELNRFQIQLLLYFLEAEPKKRTVTDAARHFIKQKHSHSGKTRYSRKNTSKKNGDSTLRNKTCSKISEAISNSRQVSAIFELNPTNSTN